MIIFSDNKCGISNSSLGNMVVDRLLIMVKDNIEYCFIGNMNIFE